jgi:hypothetical protein
MQKILSGHYAQRPASAGATVARPTTTRAEAWLDNKQVVYELARGMKILNDSPAKRGHRNKNGLKEDATDLERGVKHFVNATGSAERWKDNGWGHLPNHFHLLRGKQCLNTTGSRQRWHHHGYGDGTYDNLATRNGFPFYSKNGLTKIQRSQGAFGEKGKATTCGLALTQDEPSGPHAPSAHVRVGTPGESRPQYIVKHRTHGRDKKHFDPKHSSQYYKVPSQFNPFTGSR